MFVVKVYCKTETSPLALTLTKPVPEAFELPASDFFWPINEEKHLGDSLVFPHDALFLIDHSQESFSQKFSEQNVNNPQKLPLAQLQETNTL